MKNKIWISEEELELYKTTVCAKDKQSAIKKFTDREIYTHILSIKEVE